MRTYCSAARARIDVAGYCRDGYAIPDWRMSEAVLSRSRDALDALLASNPHVQPEQLVNAHIVSGSGSDMGVHGQSAFLELVTDPALVDLVSACLGTENVLLWACQVWCKPAGTGRAVPWHQDGQYWPIEPLRACTAWIAIDRSDAACGALEVVPGTHTHGYLPHVHREDRARSAIDFIADLDRLPPGLTLERARTLELEPGEVSLHDAWLLHGSRANTSSRRRAGVAATFMPAESYFFRDRPTEGARKGGLTLDYAQRPLFLVRGDPAAVHPDNTLVRLELLRGGD